MMRDTLRVEANGVLFEEFSAFSLDAEIGKIGSTFSITCGHPAFSKIAPGEMIGININGRPLLTGVVQTRKSSVSAGSRSTTIIGSDICGFVGTSCLTKNYHFDGVTLLRAAETICAGIIGGISFGYQDGAQAYDKGKVGVIEAGTTIGEALASMAAARGMIVWSDPSGRIMFGKALSAGELEYSIKSSPDGGDDVLSSSYTESIEKSAKTLLILTELDGDTGEPTFSRLEKAVPGYPMKAATVIVGKRNDDDPATSETVASDHISEMVREMRTLEYQIVGITCNGRPWYLNRLCGVTDTWHSTPINGPMLICGIQLEYSISGGSRSTISLSPPRWAGK